MIPWGEIHAAFCDGYEVGNDVGLLWGLNVLQKETVMSAVTARFYVSEITTRAKVQNATVVLMPAYANGANAEWATATPSGRIELQVNNPDAVKQFTDWLEQGKDLHITMEPVADLD